MYKCTVCGATSEEQTNVCPGCGSKEGTMVLAEGSEGSEAIPETDESETDSEANA